MKKGTGFLTLFGGAVAVCALLAAPVSMRAQETETIEDGVYIGNIYVGGMTEEEAANVLTNNNIVHKHGSGVGLVNVHSRIQLIFGKNYGLKVESEPDCGTTVTIRFPAIPFTEEDRSLLEQGRIPQKEGDHGDE